MGLMLMQMPAEDAFWLLVATLDKYLMGYYTPGMDRFRIHSMIFEKLLDRHLGRVSRHLVYIQSWSWSE